MTTRLTRLVCLAFALTCLAKGRAEETLRLAPRLGSEAAGLNVSHPALPGNVFDFRTCETVLDGNRDLGLFLVKLAPPGASTRPAWSTKGDGFGYEWTYSEGITVRFEATPEAESVAVAYTVVNNTTAPLKRVHLHPCVTTKEAPAFFPQLAKGRKSQLPPETAYKDYTELLTRLFLWSKGRLFRLDATEHERRQVHLALMPEGEAPIHWAWWANSTHSFDEPLIALSSRDGRWTTGLWFERAAWASANTGDDRACFHLFPLFGRIEPGASATVRGAFWLLRGGPEELHRHALRFSGGHSPNSLQLSPSTMESQ